jgi:hypothetical protein
MHFDVLSILPKRMQAAQTAGSTGVAATTRTVYRTETEVVSRTGNDVWKADYAAAQCTYRAEEILDWLAQTQHSSLIR